MNLTRRHLFKAFGGAACVLGLAGIAKSEGVVEDDSRKVLLGQVGIEWLGHGSFPQPDFHRRG